jgi:hypothetical protein
MNAYVNVYIHIHIRIFSCIFRALRLTRQSHEKDHAFAGLIALINANPQVDICICLYVCTYMIIDLCIVNILLSFSLVTVPISFLV